MITVKVKGPKSVSVRFEKTPSVNVQVIGSVIVKNSNYCDSYIGPYEIQSDFKNQTLQTKEKRMEKDVTVKALPFAEVSNEAGGTTVIIG